jgi:hypothetical protein
MTFDFITDITLTSDNENEYLSSLFSRSQTPLTQEQEVNDEVFKHVYIPRTLQELTLEEITKQQREAEKTKSTPLYSKLTGLDLPHKDPKA